MLPYAEDCIAIVGHAHAHVILSSALAGKTNDYTFFLAGVSAPQTLRNSRPSLM